MRGPSPVSGWPQVLSQLANWAEGGFGASQTGVPDGHKKNPWPNSLLALFVPVSAGGGVEILDFSTPKFLQRHQSRVEGKIRITWISLNSWCEGGVSHFPNPGSCCFPQGQEKSGWTGLAFCHCHSMNSDVPSREKATIHPCPISLLSQDPSQKTQDESWKCQLHQGSEQMDQKTQKWTKNCIPERSGKGDLGKTVFYPSRLGQKIPGVCV